MGRFEFKQCSDIEGLYVVQPYILKMREDIISKLTMRKILYKQG